MENTFKGTKGKWFVDKGIDTISINCKNFPAGIDGIAKIENQFKSDVSSANALLISKAPEMLEMLIKLNNKGGLGYETHDQIEKLIKSATEL